jgi:hypothetical protein
MLPDGCVPFLEILAAPHVIDEDVKTTLLGADAIDQLSNLVSDEMIHPNGDAIAAGCRDELGRFLYGFRPGVFGLLVACCPSGHIDGCACRTQFDRDASTCPARRARDQGDLSLKRHRSLPKNATHPLYIRSLNEVAALRAANKRTAFLAMAIFVGLNGYEIEAAQAALTSSRVAPSVPPDDGDDTQPQEQRSVEESADHAGARRVAPSSS